MSLDWQEYLSNTQYRSDNKALREFAEDFMLAFKQKNLSEGINITQALWLHQRFRVWDVSLPVEMGGFSFQVDLMNMVVAGDIETAVVALMYGAPDDMSQPYHWFNAERHGWCVAQLSAWLGW